MEERPRRSRELSCSPYSIDTLFPGLGNNSTSVSGVSSSILVDTDGSGSTQPRPVNWRKINFGLNDKEMSSDPKPTNDPMADDMSLKTERESGGDGGVNQISSKSSCEGLTKRKSGSPLKPTTQPKQMYLPIGLTKISRKGMFQVFQPWVLQTYGDSAKTKTITNKKYNRIVKTLKGEEINNAENSKFRFWVKSKGFHIGPPLGQPFVIDDRAMLQNPVANEPDLYVPTTTKDVSGLEKPIFKRVAVVEHFFDIIYMVHVETEAKNGKHAGQKRTYRAITEKYAFLPREAVTKFLLQCTECQKRGSPGAESSTSGGSGGNNNSNKIFTLERSPSPSEESGMRSGESPPSSSELDINFGPPPFPTTYLRQAKQMRGKGGFEENEHHVDDELRGGKNRMKMSHTANRKKLIPSKVKVKVRPPNRDSLTERTSGDEQDLRIKSKGVSGRSKNLEGKDFGKGAAVEAMDWLGYQPLGLKKEIPTTNNNIYSNGKHEFREQSSPLSMVDRFSVNHEPVHDETSSNGNKEDEDDDDDESEDKMDTHQHDPERLKAFNMFVRLFVDENLDRMVPISKQPKEKIQAIIDSCTRQFPEFAERARKRIRTYLKSCRRNKRSRDGGWESSESRGSKENGHHSSCSSESSPEKAASKASSNIAATIAAVASNTATANSPSSISANVPNDQNINLGLNGASSSSNGEPIHPSSVLGAKGMERTPLVDYSRALNGNGGASSMSMYRPNFNQTFQRPSPFPNLFPAVTTSAVVGALGNSTFPQNISPLPVVNGDVGSQPTDLSMKSKPILTQKLNATELATVRQLITGYRESASFLLRSADELEQLLLQQQ